MALKEFSGGYSLLAQCVDLYHEDGRRVFRCVWATPDGNKETSLELSKAPQELTTEELQQAEEKSLQLAKLGG